MLSLESPLVLLLIPIPIILALHHLRQKKTDQQLPSIYHPQAALLAELLPQAKPVLPWLWLLAIIFVILALARPQWTDTDIASNYTSHSIVLAIDTSESMRAIDYTEQNKAVSRLTVIKAQAGEFINQRLGDQIGLVVFADQAVLYSPLTFDRTSIQQFIKEIEPGMTGEKTALGDAIAAASDQLNNSEFDSKILVLFSDGNNNAGTHTLDSAIITAQQAGIRIYTVGIGHDEPVAFPRGPVLKPVLVQFPMNLGILKDIANKTGGQYFYIDDTQQLKQTLNNIAAAEPVQLKPAHMRYKLDLFWLPLVIGLLLIIIYETTGKKRISPT